MGLDGIVGALLSFGMVQWDSLYVHRYILRALLFHTCLYMLFTFTPVNFLACRWPSLAPTV